jgi:glutamate-5-semialdehyde dehydrogenase
VHESVAKKFLPKMAAAMREKNVELRGDAAVRTVVPDMAEASDEDWATEYDDLILSVKVVKDLDEAISHINRYNTGHSETIVTNDLNHAHRFQREVDAAAVYVNASTRFTDGFEFGFGAEIGISTQKLHARGPMGLNELTSTKYLIFGEGQIRG